MSSTTSPSPNRTYVPMVWVPMINAAFPSGGTCRDALCPGRLLSDNTTWSCTDAPEHFDSMVRAAIKKGSCRADRSEFTLRMVQGQYGTNYSAYPFACAFSSEECANQVCGLQRSAVNATKDNKWTCYSDPFVATAAFNNTLWFGDHSANTSADRWVADNWPDITYPSKCTVKPECSTIKGRDTTYFTAGSTRLLPLQVVLIVACALGTAVATSC